MGVLLIAPWCLTTIYVSVYTRDLCHKDSFYRFRQGKSHKSKGQMTKDDFHKFLNADQRDPRLNEILHPYTTKEHASKLISRHEKGRRGGESGRGL